MLLKKQKNAQENVHFFNWIKRDLIKDKYIYMLRSIAQIFFARNFNFLLECWWLYRRVDNIERIQSCLNEYLVYLIKEVLNAIILSIMNLLRETVRLEAAMKCVFLTITNLIWLAVTNADTKNWLNLSRDLRYVVLLRHLCSSIRSKAACAMNWFKCRWSSF